MDISNVISLLSGVALFLFGMSLMGDSLKRVAGNRLEGLLYKLTNTKLKGILLGTGVTAVIQSSSATSVMVVGFVNSGMMKFGQAIGIILGAILGTSVTGWVICLSDISGGSGWVSLLSTSTLTGLIAVSGIVVRTAAKRATHKHVGDIMMGFAVLMFGMSTMSGAVAPLKEIPAFVDLLTSFSNPILGFLAGVIFTAILQSASAAVGILQALAITGAVTFATAFPLLMGIGVGAAVPVLMAAAGANVAARRTAAVYLLAQCIGAALIGTIFYVANAFCHFPFLSATLTTVHIAALNTLYRFLCVLILAPQTGLLEKLTCAVVKENAADIEEREEQGPVFEERFLPYPPLALDQCRSAIYKMAELTQESVLLAMETIEGYSPEKAKRVVRLEKLTDRYEDSLGTYILKATKRELTTEQNQQFSCFLHCITDFERISDHARNIVEVMEAMREQDNSFTGDALAELAVMRGALKEVLSVTIKSFLGNDLALAERVEPLEEVVNELQDNIKNRHVERMKAGICTMTQGISLNDLLTDLERISDHCSNIALSSIELHKNSFRTHASLHHREESRKEIEKLYNEYSRRFALPAPSRTADAS
ncbi:MAG: Na/Pi cotransporter family protein [Oscillibacter sp.]|nr:Na/Pi cotransporter family protein [Oscillibacter sp.]